MDLVELLNKYGSASTNVILLGGVVVLWREWRFTVNRYDASLLKCIEALTRINDYLEKHHEESDHE